MNMFSIRMICCLLFFACFAFVVAMSPLHAQTAQTAWAKQVDGDIEKYRTCELRVLVVDEKGKPVPGAVVEIEQSKHAFTWGVVLPAKGVDGSVFDGSQLVWRCFNAISLDRMARWTKLQPEMDKPRGMQAVWHTVNIAQSWGLGVNWGTVLAADHGLWPEWVAMLRGRKLEAMLDRYVRTNMLEYGERVKQFDLYAGMLTRDTVSDRLGPQMLRRLYEQAKADAPNAVMTVRFSDALVGSRSQAMINKVAELREKMIPFDAIAIEQEIGGNFNAPVLARSLHWLDAMDTDVVISGLEVGGGSEAGAAFNLDIMLRILFAQPNVKGIYIRGLTPSETNDPNASLIDLRGHLTQAGRAFEKLVHGEWWTNLKGKTDSLGNYRARVFAGNQRVVVRLPNGLQLQTNVWLTPGPGERMVMLEPLKQEKP